MENKKPLWKRWYVWIGGLLILGMITSLFGSDDEPEDIETALSITASETISETEPPETEAETTAHVNVNIGDIWEDEITETSSKPPEEITSIAETTTAATTTTVTETTTAVTTATAAEITVTTSTTAAARNIIGYRSATGDKFHSINNCGNMNPDRARAVYEGDSIASFDKCDKCW